MSSAGAAPRAAVQISDARAAASRRNGAKARGPKTPEGQARAAQNALKHGMRALTYVVLPDESAAEFAALEAALLDELAPVGALQVVLARRVAIAAWRLARADRLAAETGLGPRRRTERGWAPFPNQSGDAQPGGQQVELLTERRWDGASVGVALIRDGNGTRSFETLMRYRGAATAELMRALRTLKALQAEQAAFAQASPAHPSIDGGRAPNEPGRPMQYALPEPAMAGRTLHGPAAGAPYSPEPNEPEGGPERELAYVLPDPPAPGRTLYAPAAPWLPNEPEPATALAPAPALPVEEAPPRHRHVVVHATRA